MHLVPPTSPDESLVDMNESYAPAKGRRRKSTGTTGSVSPTSPKSKHIKCSNCATENTPLWRKGADGNTLCNKCGVYWKRHNKNRPIEREQERRESIPTRVEAEEPSLAASSTPPPSKAASPINRKRAKKTSSSSRTKPVQVLDEEDEPADDEQDDIFLQPTTKKKRLEQADTEDLVPSAEQLMSLQQQLAAFAIMQQKLAGHSDDLQYSFTGEPNFDSLDPTSSLLLSPF
jgi:uncharacterized Zn finger protein (UPF0148 family)